MSIFDLSISNLRCLWLYLTIYIYLSITGAWRQVVAYHDECDHDIVPEYIEVGFHDYEASCEDYFCNLIGPGVDQTVCPFAPPSPPQTPPLVLTSDDDLAAGAIAGIVVAAGVALLAIVCVCVMIQKEKSGKPMFTNIDKGMA